MRFRAVTVATIAVPAMSFEFEMPSVNAAMEFLCRSVPMMKGIPYDFELFYLPVMGDYPDMLESVTPKLVGTTRTTVSTRFVKNQGFSMPSAGEGEAKVLEVA